MQKLGILLLAAGESKRMGSPKQLLDFKGKKLIQHSIAQLLPLKSNNFLVVLGANQEQILPFCQFPNVRCTIHPNWEKGMGSSIAFGLNQLLDFMPDLSHVLIALADQPFIETQNYQTLAQATMHNPSQISAAFYDEKVGAPIIFPKEYFAALSKLEGDQGARKIVRNIPTEQLNLVSMPQAALDWDSPEDILL